MSKTPAGCGGWIVAGLLGIGLVSQCGKDVSTSTSADPLLAYAAPAASRMAYVQPERLNCRSSPSTGSDIVARLDRGDSVRVLEEQAGWSRLDRLSECWVSTRLLDAVPPPYRETPPAPVQRFSGGGDDNGGAPEPRASRLAVSFYYANCSAARAAGAAPVYADDPGYSRRLDRDGDGIGCEN